MKKPRSERSLVTEGCDTPLWQNAVRLTKDQEWRSTQVGNFARERSVTWARFPYRYMLTEFGKQEGRILRRYYTAMFELGRISARNAVTGLHEISRYYILGGEFHAVLHYQTPPLDKLTDELRAGLKTDLNFTIDNRLYAPNEEDNGDLEEILKIGYMDGVTPYAQVRG